MPLRPIVLAALALLLAGCATYDGGYYRERHVYRDGSYYERYDDGYGDYYYGRPDYGPRTSIWLGYGDPYWFGGYSYWYGPGWGYYRYPYPSWRYGHSWPYYPRWPSHRWPPHRPDRPHWPDRPDHGPRPPHDPGHTPPRERRDRDYHDIYRRAYRQGELPEAGPRQQPLPARPQQRPLPPPRDRDDDQRPREPRAGMPDIPRQRPPQSPMPHWRGGAPRMDGDAAREPLPVRRGIPAMIERGGPPAHESGGFRHADPAARPAPAIRPGPAARPAPAEPRGERSRADFYREAARPRDEQEPR